MMSNKEGQLIQNRLIGILLLTVAFAIILIAIIRFFPVFVGEFDDGACKISVDLKANYIENNLAKKAGSTLLYGVPQLKCKTEYECFSTGGDCLKGYEKVKVKTEEDIKKKLADSMYSCWDKLGNGQKNFFERDLTKQSYCVFCSSIVFDEEIQKDYPEIGRLSSYLAKNKPYGTNLTYWQHFITPKGVPITVSDERYNPEIQTNQEYVVVYSLLKKDYLVRALTAGTVGGIASWGIVPGATSLGAGIGSIAGPIGTVIGGGAGFVGGFALSIAGGVAAGDAVQRVVEDNPNAEYFVKLDLAPFKVEDLQKVGCTQIESIP